MAYANEVTIRRRVVFTAVEVPPPPRPRPVRKSRRDGRGNSHREGYANLAAGLGWFSIALGAAEIAAPKAFTRMLGMRGSETLLQAYGAREIATGIGILASKNPAPWMWGRVGGDAIDMVTLGAGLSEDNPKRQNVAMAMAAVAGVSVLDAVVAKRLSEEKDGKIRPRRDYSGRSGFPMHPEMMRGAASDFQVPEDFRTPELLRPWTA